MNFRSVSDMQSDIIANLHRIPPDVDVVVGIPRSGMLAASLVALARNLPLADLSGFAEGRMLGCGKTRRQSHFDLGVGDFKHALVMDDSIRTGAAMNDARAILSAVSARMKVSYCAVYGTSASGTRDEIVLDVVKSPRIFEWNLLHHRILENACVDIDGVLCADPTDAENDDGDAYKHFLLNATPLHRPSHIIGALVTSRLEKYRPETEDWLRRHGVKHKRLFMLDLPDAETRRRQNAHGAFKGEIYKKSTAELFIESDLAQASRIAAISGKPVLCMDGPRMAYPNALSPVALRQTVRLRGVKTLVARALGDRRYEQLKGVVRPMLARISERII